MPPDDTDGPGDDLPGLHDDQLDDADLPGLDEIDSSTESDASTDAAETPDGDVLDQLDENLAEQGARFDAEAAARDQAHAELDEWRELAGDTVTTHEWDRMSLEKKKWIRKNWWSQVFRGLRGRRPWLFVGGGFGILGLVLAVGFFTGDGDDPAVAVISDTPAVETVAPSTAVLVEDTEAPAVAVDTPEMSVVPVVIDPGDYVRCREATVVADLNGDAWIMATPAAPWLPGPGPDTTWSLILDVGIDLGTQSNTVRWTLYDGSTRGESHISGDNVKAALDSEMWVTPEGQVAVKLPGTSPTGGLSVTDIGPDAGITWFGQLWPQEDSEFQQWDETKPLGEITQVTDALPRPGWERIETDFGPITLIIPDTSND